MMVGTVVSLNGMSRLVVEKDSTKIEKNVGTKDKPIWKLEMHAWNDGEK